MAMTPTQACSALRVNCIWTVKERLWLPISRREIWKPVLTQKNTFTTNGLTQLASAISGSYVAPNYLVLNKNTTGLTNNQSPGDTSVTLNSRIDQAGDTQIVLSLGLANQEVVTFSAVNTVSGKYVYTLSSPLVSSHSAGDLVTRQPNANDTMSNITAEQQYDPTNAANSRLQSVAGYSAGPGNWVIQFYFVAQAAVFYISDIALADNITIGQGTLHNHCVLGYDHSAGTSDVEIDGSLTLTNA